MRVSSTMQGHRPTAVACHLAAEPFRCLAVAANCTVGVCIGTQQWWWGM